MPIATAVTKLLGIEHPVLLAPMDVVADARLVAAVCNAGGFGILGGGYGDAEWLSRELDALGSLRRPFGVGFITWSLAKQPRLLDMTLERKPTAVMLSFGDVTPFVDSIKRAGAHLICQVQSLAIAREAVDAGADMLVAQGTEAGGHGAARGLVALLPEIVDAFGRDLPVVAAGGLADGRGLAAALMLGASGVLLGTRFYACTEAPSADAAKARVCAATGDDTARSVVFDILRRNVWPAPFTGRCLRNAQLDRWLGHELQLLQQLDAESERFAAARRERNFDVAAVIAGESAGLVPKVEPAGAIIGRMIEDASRLLAGGAANFALSPA